MRTFALALAVLCTPFAYVFAQTTTSSIQTATPASLQSAGGFLDVCGRKEDVSKENFNAMKNAASGEAWNTILQKALDASLADKYLCVGYLNGLREGWEEGHDDGVLAAHFPAGVPRDKSNPFHVETKSVPTNGLEAMTAAFKNDVWCLPEHTSIGEIMDAVIKYIRNFSLKDPFWRNIPTSRFVAPALRDAFPCPVRVGTIVVTSVPDGADFYSDGPFVGNCPATLKLTVGKHTVRVSKDGYKDWSREITVLDGSEVKLTATLEKK
jgi:PEGA domain-containing protein/Ssp1 endopeptidase immunity protein Rap1a